MLNNGIENMMSMDLVLNGESESGCLNGFDLMIFFFLDGGGLFALMSKAMIFFLKGYISSRKVPVPQPTSKTVCFEDGCIVLRNRAYFFFARFLLYTLKPRPEEIHPFTY